MVLLFWGLVIGIIGGLWLLWLLARKRGVRRYRFQRPPGRGILWALGRSMIYTLWAMAPRYPLFRAEPPIDGDSEYVNEFEREVENRKDDSPR